VRGGLAARGAAAEWVTEREPERGVEWLPREWAADAVRPDGVLRVRASARPAAGRRGGAARRRLPGWAPSASSGT
jgi:hypothetical protein